MLLTPAEATAFAEKHVQIWNSHDLDRILALYADEVELASPLAARLTGGGVVKGKDPLRQYFASALEKYPDLEFKLLNTLLCVNSVTLYFKSIDDQLVAEVLFLDADRKIAKVFAHYAC